MSEQSQVVRGVRVPAFIYGTAWKEERTQGLVESAIAAGFRGIDTANQRRHYHEEGVGRALESAMARGVRREELFVQTKFTYRSSQDHRLPYDPEAPIADQVEQSLESSLEHLGLERIDSYLLHGPSRSRGLGPEDQEAWRAMESLQQAGRVGLIGISNVRAEQLDALCRFAKVPPALVQNRCFAELGWDSEVRALCHERGVVYQGFSLLTANPRVVNGPAVRAVATRRGRTAEQVVFACCLQMGMVALTGTTDRRHMEQDLESLDLDLSPEERRSIVHSS